VFENKVLKRIYGLKRDDMTRGGENFITRSFITYALHQV
jgi:hypothetical protein